MQPKVSVLIPAYNHEKYIGAAVESVLAQTVGDFELLIADDCSTDNTRQVISAFKDSRIKTFFFEENGGTVNALNTLLRAARGEFIAVLGSDDEWQKDKLEKQLAALEKTPEAAACFSYAEIIDEQGNPVKKSAAFPVDIFNIENTGRTDLIREFFLTGNHLCHSSALIRADAHKKIGEYRVGLRQLHDFDLWIRLLLEYPIHITKEKLVKYRVATDRPNVSEATRENNIRLYNEAKFVFSDMFANISDGDFRAAFGEYFVKKGELSAAALLCEKFFLLWEKALWGKSCRALALDFLMQKLCDPAFCRCMKEEYGYTVNDIYKLTGQLATDCPAEMYEQNDAAALKAELDGVYNSRAWKIACSIKKIKALFRRNG